MITKYLILSISLFFIPFFAHAADIEISDNDVFITGTGQFTTVDFSAVSGLTDGSTICDNTNSTWTVLGGFSPVGADGGWYGYEDSYDGSTFTQSGIGGQYYPGNCPVNDAEWGTEIDISAIQIMNTSELLPDGNYWIGFIGSPNNYYWNYTVSSGEVTNTGGTDTRTRIISMLPDNGETTNPVVFSLHAYINPDDLGSFSSIKLNFSYQSQNTILAREKYILDFVQATTSGHVYYSIAIPLEDGNYISNAFLQTTYLYGIFAAPFGTKLTQDYKLWWVGATTTIGTAYQTGIGSIQDVLNAYTGTSTVANLNACNFLSLSQFSIPVCLYQLFVPSSELTGLAIDSAKENLLSRWPWGYVTRFVSILSTSTPTVLPVISVSIPTGHNDSENLYFDPSDMLSGGADLLSNIDDGDGHTLRDFAEPIIQLFVAISVIIIIFHDLMAMGRSRKGHRIE